MNANQSFGQYLRSLGVITHFGEITSDNSSCLACNRTSRKIASVTDNWTNVTCKQCLRIRSRWNANPELANQFRFNVELAKAR